MDVSKLQDAMAKEDARFDFMQKAVINFDSKKVDMEFFKEYSLEMKENLSQMSKRLDETTNQTRSLQNWVEKYEPLKV